MQLEKIDLGLVEYEINAVLRLLDVFEEWYDGELKVDDLDRSGIVKPLVWANAPKYSAVLDSSIDQLCRIYRELKKFNDEQE